MIGAIIGGIGALANVAAGIDWGGKKAAAARDAEKALQARITEFENMDTSNLAANLRNPFAENVYEDLTINQKQAEFQAQQFQQSQANTIGSLSQAAGGSGIAALAQTMSNQASLQAQRAAASIGQQEAQNQRLAAQGALQVQEGESATQAQILAGAASARDLQYQRQQGLMALASGQLGAAQANQQAGKDQVMSGFGQLAGVGIQAMESGVFDGVKLPKWLGGNDEEKQVDEVVVKKT